MSTERCAPRSRRLGCKNCEDVNRRLWRIAELADNGKKSPLLDEIYKLASRFDRVISVKHDHEFSPWVGVTWCEEARSCGCGKTQRRISTLV